MLYFAIYIHLCLFFCIFWQIVFFILLFSSKIIAKSQNPSIVRSQIRCLGKIGALNPIKVQAFAARDENCSFSSSQVFSSAYCINLLLSLYKSYMNYSTVAHQDATMYAIQEIIKLYNIKTKKSDKIWNALPDDTQEVLLPLATSK